MHSLRHDSLVEILHYHHHHHHLSLPSPGTDKQVGVIAVTEKGNLDLKVTTKAKGGSTSVPATEMSAIGRLSQVTD